MGALHCVVGWWRGELPRLSRGGLSGQHLYRPEAANSPGMISSTSRVPNLECWPAADMCTTKHWGPCVQHGHNAALNGHLGRPARAPPKRDATRRASRRRPPQRPRVTTLVPRRGLLLHRAARDTQRTDRAPAAHGRSCALRGRAIVARVVGLRGAHARAGERAASAHRAAVRARKGRRGGARKGSARGGCRPALDDRTSRRSATARSQ